MASYQKIPTTADIYLEVDGVKIAVVQSYRAISSRAGKAVRAFGQSEPVATIYGAEEYKLELTRLYATDTAIRDGIDFFSLKDFTLVVCKPDRNIIYTGCQWLDLEESAQVGGSVMEKITISAAHRLSTAV